MDLPHHIFGPDHMFGFHDLRSWLGCSGLVYRRLGGAQPGNRFVSFVCAYARSGSEVGIGENRAGHVTFPFSLLAQDGISFEFCVVLLNPGEI